MPERNINGAWYWECNDTLISNYTRISNYGIGKNIVDSSGCGYKPIGQFGNNGADVWEDSPYSTRIMLIPSMDIPNNLIGAKPADNPTRYYEFNNRQLQFSGLGACYWSSPLVTRIVSSNIVADGGLFIGNTLAYLICFGGYGLNGNTLLGCCRDMYTGSEYILDNYTSTNQDMRRQIAYGNWWNHVIPDVIKYADHVTVYRPWLDTSAYLATNGYGKGGYLSHPKYSYFRSASILYSNTRPPNDVTESDAENENGNLVFDVYTDTKWQWHQLCILETWDSGYVYPYSWDGLGDHSGGSRSTILYRLTDTGLEFGAIGEMGGRSRSETQCTYGNLAVLANHKLTFEMVNDADYDNNELDGPYSDASFAGHGINIKARVKSVD